MKALRNILLLVAVCVTLQYFGIVDFGQLVELDRAAIFRTLLPCALVLLLVNTLAAFRWIWTMSRLFGSKVDVLAGLSVTYKSGLFAYFLPGQLGSELGRVILASRGGSSESRNIAVTAAIIDRAMALASQLVMVTVFIAYVFWHRSNRLQIAIAVVGAGIVMVVLALLAGKLVKSTVFAFKTNKYVDYAGNILKIVKTFIGTHPGFCALLLLFSMVLNLIVAAVIYLVVVRIVYPYADFATVVLMSLASNLSAVIPITPGGVGISELVFRETAALVNQLSVENLAVAYVLFRVLNVASYGAGTVLAGGGRLLFMGRSPAAVPGRGGSSGN